MHHPSSRRYPKLALSAMLVMCSLGVYSSHAALTDLTTTPLGTSTNGTVVKRNVLFLLDGSGSMGWKFSPDNVDPNTCCGAASSAGYTCRTDSSGSNTCSTGDPPYMADRSSGIGVLCLLTQIFPPPASNYTNDYTLEILSQNRSEAVWLRLLHPPYRAHALLDS
jgi:hypothetical protein